MSTATGFVYCVDTDHGLASFLVTNRHVLADAEELTVRFVCADATGEPQLGMAAEIQVAMASVHWTAHADPAIDVACVALQPLLELMQAQGTLPCYRRVTPELSYGVGISDELDSLEEVTFIGYPNGLFDSQNLLPIARRGITATPVGVDYQGKPTFLVDAAVIQGSSGSPVFIANQGVHTSRDGTAHVGGRVMLLGVIAAVHTRKFDATIAEEPTALAASFDFPIGLGIVYRAVCIDECVEQVLSRAGITRRPNRAEPAT